MCNSEQATYMRETNTGSRLATEFTSTSPTHSVVRPNTACNTAMSRDVIAQVWKMARVTNTWTRHTDSQGIKQDPEAKGSARTQSDDLGTYQLCKAAFCSLLDLFRLGFLIW